MYDKFYSKKAFIKIGNELLEEKEAILVEQIDIATALNSTAHASQYLLFDRPTHWEEHIQDADFTQLDFGIFKDFEMVHRDFYKEENLDELLNSPFRQNALLFHTAPDEVIHNTPLDGVDKFWFHYHKFDTEKGREFILIKFPPKDFVAFHSHIAPRTLLEKVSQRLFPKK